MCIDRVVEIHLQYTVGNYDMLTKYVQKVESKMLKRRQFIILSYILGLTPYVQAKAKSKFKKEFEVVEDTIRAVQEHMFPEGSKLPSARSMNATQFLYDTISHKSYDKDIKVFVIEGAQELIEREKGLFHTMSTEEKEKSLRAYEETNYGSSWLSRMMTLTMEGLFCDPIYGSNVKEAGWKTLGAYGGFPRPKTKYLES